MLYLQIFNAQNNIIFKISARGLFLKYSKIFANFSLDNLMKKIPTKKRIVSKQS